MDFLLALAELDGTTLAVLAFGMALAGLLFGVAGSWRRLLLEAPDLPLWVALGREGIARRIAEDRAGSRAIRNAELRCMLCVRRVACEAQLSRGGKLPEECANRPLAAALHARAADRFAGGPTLHLT